MPRVKIGLQIEETSPLVRHLIGSGKGVSEWDGIDPDEIVKVTYTVESSDIQEINPGIYYNIPSITTAKQGDTLFSDDGRLFKYDEAGSRWFLWYTFDNATAKIHTNNTLKGEGTLDDPLTVNATVVALKGDLNPLLEGTDNGDGTYTFASVDGNTSFTIDPAAIAPVQSVNGQTGTVVLDPDDLDDTSTTNKFVTQGEKDDIASSVQPGDNITELTNNAPFVSVIPDIDTLRNTVPGDENVFVEGYYSDSPGVGGGDFWWDESSVEDDNGGTIFKPDDSLLGIDHCENIYNGTTSVARASNNTTIGHLRFPAKIRFKTTDNEFYLMGRSGWLTTELNSPFYGLIWGIRYYSGSVLQFFINDPSEGAFTITATGIFFYGSEQEIIIDEDGTDVVMYLNGVELGRITSWNRTTVNADHVRLRVGVSDAGSPRYFNGSISYIQLGTEIWDHSECSGTTITSNQGRVLILTDVTWNQVYKGRWKRFESGEVNVKDFGAKGDGNTNDTDALYAAGKQIERQGGGKLIFPAGTYLVGKQEYTGLTTGKAYTYSPIIDIRNCDNAVVIEGAGSKIQAVDGLRYGSFDPVTGDPYTPGSLPFTDQDYNVGVYSGMIRVENCFSLSINDFELFGNNENFILGGEWGDTGRQCAGTGVYMKNIYSVKLSNIKSNHHGLDGIYYQNDGLSPNSAPTPLVMENVDANYNGRQGFSNTGGILGTAINCNFSHTGKGGLASSPRAGVDFEPEGSVIRKFTFLNCEFSNNAGRAFVADSGNTADVKFLNCQLIGTTNYSLWADKPGIYFEKCLIAGTIAHLHAGNVSEATIFKNCIITDDNSYSPTGQVFSDIVGLFNLSLGTNVKFKECYFKATQGLLGRLNGGIIEDCEFLLETGTEYIADHAFALHLGSSTLIDCTITEDIQGTLPDDGYYIYVGGLKSIGKNTLISNNNKLQWDTWASWGWTGDFADNQGRPFNRIELSAGGGINPGNTRSIRYSASPPTSENYITGDVVLNNQPSSGSPTGWICTVSGSTGVNAVFEPFGTVGGSGVQTTTGDGIDNSDPQNPVWSFPDPSEIGALQSGDNISELVNDEGFVDAAGAAAAAPVQSVNGDTGAVTLDADDISDASTSNKFVTQSEKNDIASAVQPGDLATVATSGDYDDLINTPPPIAPHNVFLQNSANEVENLGTTESTILNINSGSTYLSTADCAIGQSYEFTVYGANKWDSGPGNSVTIRFYLNGQSTSVNFNAKAVTYTPIVIKGTVNFISGADATRVVQVAGVVYRASGSPSAIVMMPSSTMTVDVTSGATVDITSQNIGGVDSGFRADSVVFNRITFNS